VHHAFLFTGTRGVGKTTIARIFAKCLNCERAEASPNGFTAEPCGKCSACVEIDSGRFVDLMEIDAASRTKVDDTRELLDNVQYAPTRARYKVYLIDEVHMLSTHSFNALLKTLEEPPPHVKFLLATTDPQKLPVTVLSRCLQFNLKRLPVAQISDHMRHVLEAEKVPAEAAGIRLVAVAADGSMRDGLSLLDQLIAFGGGKVDEESARAMLGTIARDHVVKLAETLAGGDASALVRYAQTLEQWAPDYAQVLDELSSLLVRVAMKQAVNDYEGDDIYSPDVLAKLAKAFSAEDVQLYYQTAIIGRRDLPLAPDPRTGFDMTLLRMLAFRPGDAGVAASGAQVPRVAQSANGAPRASAAASSSSAPRAAPASATSASPSAPAAASAGPTSAAPVGEVTAGSWSAVVNELGVAGSARQLANHCAFIGRKGNVVKLGFDPKSPFVRTQGQVEKLAQALSKYYGETVRIEFEALVPGQETPAQAGQRANLQELDSARQSLEADPGVQVLREKFGATLLPDSVRPVK
jgi:DNA polymerase-3 subunit gamma/tau